MSVPSRSEVSSYFDTWAREGIYPRLRREEYTDVLRLAPVLQKPGKRVIDVGCGPGYIAEAAKSLGHRVVGVDLSAEALAQARAAGRIDEAVVASATAMTLPDESADAVLFFGILYGVAELAAALKEGARVLRPGGNLIVFDHHSRNPYTKLHFARPRWADRLIDGRENLWRRPLDEKLIEEAAPPALRWEPARFFNAFTRHPDPKIDVVHHVARAAFGAIRMLTRAPWTGCFVACIATKR